MIESLHRWDVTPTINVTASTLDSCPELVHDLENADLGIHGYRHVSYADLPVERQADDLDRAIGTFRNHGLETRGFRGPYLRINEATQRLLEARGLKFDSSLPTIVGRLGGHMPDRMQALLQRRYPAALSSRSLPFRSGRLVEIPVSLPDDEILIDGMGVTNQETIYRVLRSMLDETLKSNSLLVLQIHPERFHYCDQAVLRLLDDATIAGFWKASLTEVAEWTNHCGGSLRSWPNGQVAAIVLSGDLDALSLRDFGPRMKEATLW